MAQPQKGGAARPQGQQQPAPEPRRPVAEFKMGLCCVSVWQNQNPDGKVRYSASFQRSYTDANGQWQTTQSLNRDDIPLMMAALQQALVFCYSPRGEAAEE